MNIFLKGTNGNAMPASQNLGSDYCCSGAGSKKIEPNTTAEHRQRDREGHFLAH
jgi:hypothetical protein